MSGVEFRDPDRKLSATLFAVAERLPPGSASLRDLIALSGEQGLLLLCALLTLPFLLPVSVPGVSTVFGAAIILIGVGVTLNRVPWLPRRILDRPLPTAQIKSVFGRGARGLGVPGVVGFDILNGSHRLGHSRKRQQAFSYR